MFAGSGRGLKPALPPLAQSWARRFVALASLTIDKEIRELALVSSRLANNGSLCWLRAPHLRTSLMN